LSLHFFESIECAVSVAVLPDGNNGVEYKDEKDYEGFHVGSQTLITVTYFKSKCGQTKILNVKTEPRMLENKRVKFEARSDCFARAFMTDTKMIALAYLVRKLRNLPVTAMMNEMVADASRMRTRMSSNCSTILSQSDFSSSASNSFGPC